MIDNGSDGNCADEYSSHSAMSVHDMTPMVDILFMLIVFFMLMIGVSVRAFDLHLPEADTEHKSSVSAADYGVLEITDDYYSLNGKVALTLDELEHDLQDVLLQSSGYSVMVASDRDVAVERVLQALVYLRTHGVYDVRFLLEGVSSSGDGGGK